MTTFVFLHRFSLLRITQIEAEYVRKAAEAFIADWGEYYKPNDIMVMKQRDTPGGPRYEIIADSIQDWLYESEAPVRFAESVLEAFRLPVPELKEDPKVTIDSIIS